MSASQQQYASRLEKKGNHNFVALIICDLINTKNIIMRLVLIVGQWCVTYWFICGLIRLHGYIILITVLGVSAGGRTMHWRRSGWHWKPRETEQHSQCLHTWLTGKHALGWAQNIIQTFQTQLQTTAAPVLCRAHKQSWAAVGQQNSFSAWWRLLW